MFHHEDHCQGRDQKGTPANIRFWHEADQITGLEVRCERIAEVSQLFPMVFHSPATNTHRCHGKFQHLIQT